MKMTHYHYLIPIRYNEVPKGFVQFRGSHLFVSKAGKVWSGILCKFVDGSHSNGYIFFRVRLAPNSPQIKVGIHRMIAECYIPNPDNYRLVRHLNDIKSDNRIKNLAWGNDLENIRDAFRNGRMTHNNHRKGEDAGRAKLTELQAIEIKRRKAEGERTIILAKEFNVDSTTIMKIFKNISWTHLKTT